MIFSDYVSHGGGCAPLWQIRKDQIAAISGVYGLHGEQKHPDGTERFGPFVDVYLVGGAKIVLENCSGEYDGNMSTADWILFLAMKPTLPKKPSWQFWK
jgi:hypothetical protein